MLRRTLPTLAARYVAAIDQGTSSTRCILFDHLGNKVASHQLALQNHTPQAGWVEHCPEDILHATTTCLNAVVVEADVQPGELASVGITNQRETTVVWRKSTGRTLHRAVVWLDQRCKTACDALSAQFANHVSTDGGGDGDKARGVGVDYFRPVCGLPISPYFSAMKLRWLLANVPCVKAAADDGDLAVGTIDSWLVWHLTGGVAGGAHVTDVTNASRTMLMSLKSAQWSPSVCAELDVPMAALPAIRSSAEQYGVVADAVAGVPVAAAARGVAVAGVLGDQQAALVGQLCFGVGESKK
jgi:glycerol kinase